MTIFRISLCHLFDCLEFLLVKMGKCLHRTSNVENMSGGLGCIASMMFLVDKAEPNLGDNH